MRPAWTPTSWKSFPAAQQPVYQDSQAISHVLEQLHRMPPLVTSWEVDRLRDALALAQKGEAWLLQGGDCAERFEDCQAEPIASKLKVLLQMSLAILFGGRRRVIRVGRIAGQYAKPRSSDTETISGQTLPCYRGDLINHHGFSADERKADPQLLLRGYERAALTLNFIRGLSEGGFADLHHPDNWNLVFVNAAKEEARYRKLLKSLGDALNLIETITGGPVAELRRVDFYTSHEALHLDYEAALTRPSVRGIGYYNFGTHFPWIGERTRDLQGAHLEYCRGIRNPIAVKVGGSMEPGKLLEMARLLNPEQEPGRLTLIHRMGAASVAKKLPALVESIHREGIPVLWVCDPMHGNTISTSSGRKTRRFGDIVEELRQSFAIHRSLGSHLGGVHLELTGEDVTECVGGSGGLTEDDLATAYQTQLDPRLNYEQAMEIAFEIAHQLGHPADGDGALS
jgi:3-deoxy-7-phosphoheptulonate synthase